MKRSIYHFGIGMGGERMEKTLLLMDVGESEKIVLFCFLTGQELKRKQEIVGLIYFMSWSHGWGIDNHVKDF
jgi:hypothetical protein